MVTYDNLVKDLDILLDDHADLPLKFKGLYIETDRNQMILISERFAVI